MTRPADVIDDPVRLREMARTPSGRLCLQSFVSGCRERARRESDMAHKALDALEAVAAEVRE